MKIITNRKVGKYVVVEDVVRIGQDLYKTQELMTEDEIQKIQE